MASLMPLFVPTVVNAADHWLSVNQESFGGYSRKFEAEAALVSGPCCVSYGLTDVTARPTCV
jgi:hypothetical protein